METIGDGNIYTTDKSKEVAVVPPTFGTSTTTNQTITMTTTVATTNVVAQSTSTTSTGYTAVTSTSYYANGTLGTLSIPSVGLCVSVYEGTDDSALLNGAGHFENTSIWDGNVSIAGHNRGVNNHFGEIHTLNLGDMMELKTQWGTRTYTVSSIQKISADDVSVLYPSSENRLTLITCVMDEPDYRWCVIGTSS